MALDIGRLGCDVLHRGWQSPGTPPAGLNPMGTSFVQRAAKLSGAAQPSRLPLSPPAARESARARLGDSIDGDGCDQDDPRHDGLPERRDAGEAQAVLEDPDEQDANKG